MNLLKLLGTSAIVGVFAIAGRAQDLRFSHTLTNAQCVASGIVKLSTDQIAVLDALVRRDAKIQAFPDTAHPAPARFSLRLVPDERRGAGLGLLTGAEVSYLDTLVADFESGRLPAAPAANGGAGWKPAVTAPHPEIHGLLTFTYGAGRGGYQEMGGAMEVSIDDPAHGLSLLFGYGTARIKDPYLDAVGCAPGGYLPGGLLRRAH